MIALTPLLAGFAMSTAAQEPQYDMKLIQLVFLVDPKVEKPLPEGAKNLQGEHLKYLESLWEKRQAILVGPMMEAKPRRGLVLLDVDTKEKAEEIMGQDPYVKAGQLDLEIIPWFVARNVPQKGPKFLDIEQYWFGTLTRVPDAAKISKEEAEAIQAGHMANINRMAEEGALVLAGPMGGGTDFRGIFIFRNLPKDKIMELAGRDPAIQKGRLELKLYPWYTAKGTFAEKKPGQ